MENNNIRIKYETEKIYLFNSDNNPVLHFALQQTLLKFNKNRNVSNKELYEYGINKPNKDKFDVEFLKFLKDIIEIQEK